MNDQKPYIKAILRRIPSKLMREHLKQNLPELSLLQWASIGSMVMRPQTQAKLFREMLPFASTDYERELLGNGAQDIERVGYVDALAQTAYDKQHDPETVPFFPFLERCHLPILLKVGDLTRVRRGRKTTAYLISDTPDNLPDFSDLTDESYLCYSLDECVPEDLFEIHDHIHVCYADACSEVELSPEQMRALCLIKQKLEAPNG